MSDPIVVAFDLSLTSTGVADSNGTRRITPKTKGPERLAEIRDEVLEATHPDRPGEAVCSTCWQRRSLVHLGDHPDLVVIEGYSYGSPNQAHPVGEMGGVVRLALWEAGLPFEVVTPSTIKQYATGKGNASKDDVLLAAVRRLGYEGKSKDEADALWLYALTMHALGAPIATVPAAHLKALKALTWANRITTGAA